MIENRKWVLAGVIAFHAFNPQAMAGGYQTITTSFVNNTPCYLTNSSVFTELPGTTQDIFGFAANPETTTTLPNSLTISDSTNTEVFFHLDSNFNDPYISDGCGYDDGSCGFVDPGTYEVGPDTTQITLTASIVTSSNPYPYGGCPASESTCPAMHCEVTTDAPP